MKIPDHNVTNRMKQTTGINYQLSTFYTAFWPLSPAKSWLLFSAIFDNNKLDFTCQRRFICTRFCSYHIIWHYMTTQAFSRAVLLNQNQTITCIKLPRCSVSGLHTPKFVSQQKQLGSSKRSTPEPVLSCMFLLINLHVFPSFLCMITHLLLSFYDPTDWPREMSGLNTTFWSLEKIGNLSLAYNENKQLFEGTLLQSFKIAYTFFFSFPIYCQT